MKNIIAGVAHLRRFRTFNNLNLVDTNLQQKLFSHQQIRTFKDFHTDRKEEKADFIYPVKLALFTSVSFIIYDIVNWKYLAWKLGFEVDTTAEEEAMLKKKRIGMPTEALPYFR